MLYPLSFILVICHQGRTDTNAFDERAIVNFPSESSIAVYGKVSPLSRETLAAYSLFDCFSTRLQEELSVMQILKFDQLKSARANLTKVA